MNSSKSNKNLYYMMEILFLHYLFLFSSVVSMLLCHHQKGFTKFPCFICEWNHKQSKRSPLVQKTIVIEKTFDTQHEKSFDETLVDSKKILLPPLHIKLGLMNSLLKLYLKMVNMLNVCIVHFLIYQKLQ